jgi:hypothetical protein
MNDVRELNCLELENICAGMSKGETEAATAPAPGTAGPRSLRDRVIEMKKFFGLPEWMHEIGLPQILPR